MEIGIRLVGLLQRLDLSTRTVCNMMELELEDGYKLMVPIQESDAERITNLSVNGCGYQDPTPEPEQCMAPSTVEQCPLVPSSELEYGTPARPESALPTTSFTVDYYQGYKPEKTRRGKTSHKPVPPVRTVPSDESGNPIVPNNRMADSIQTADEDGVPSI